MKQFMILLKQPGFYLPFMSALLVNALCWMLIVFRLPARVTWIPLHYSSFFGIDWIGPWIYIIYYPVVSLLILLINTLLIRFLSSKSRFFLLLLIWSALLVQVITLISLITLIINYFE